MQEPLSINRIGTPFIELQSVDSTNNYARAQLHAELAPHGTAVFAHEQVAGKGQRGRVWLSEKDQNIALSVVIRPVPLAVSNPFPLTACMAVAVHDFFAGYAGEEVCIKWPNDLYWRDRKAGGILIESGIGAPGKNKGVPAWEWAVAGIGININQVRFPEHLPNPVSLRQITGKMMEPVVLAKELCSKLDLYYSLLARGEWEPIQTRYLAHLYRKNEWVKFRKDNRLFEARVITVTPDGKLVVQHGMEETFRFGEVEWIT